MHLSYIVFLFIYLFYTERPKEVLCIYKIYTCNIYTFIYTQIIMQIYGNYNQCYWASVLPPARAIYAFPR